MKKARLVPAETDARRNSSTVLRTLAVGGTERMGAGPLACDGISRLPSAIFGLVAGLLKAGELERCAFVSRRINLVVQGYMKRATKIVVDLRACRTPAELSPLVFCAKLALSLADCTVTRLHPAIDTPTRIRIGWMIKTIVTRNRRSLAVLQRPLLTDTDLLDAEVAQCPQLRAWVRDDFQHAAVAHHCGRLESLQLNLGAMGATLAFKCAPSLASLVVRLREAQVEFLSSFTALTALNCHIGVNLNGDLDALSRALLPLTRLRALGLHSSGFKTDRQWRGVLAIPGVCSLALEGSLCGRNGFGNPLASIAAPKLESLSSTNSNIFSMLTTVAMLAAPDVRSFTFSGNCNPSDDTEEFCAQKYLRGLIVHPHLARVREWIMPNVDLAADALDLIDVLPTRPTRLEGRVPHDDCGIVSYCSLAFNWLEDLRLYGRCEDVPPRQAATVMRRLTRLHLCRVPSLLFRAFEFPALATLHASIDSGTGDLLNQCPRLQYCSLGLDGILWQPPVDGIGAAVLSPRLLVTQLRVNLTHLCGEDVDRLLSAFPNARWLGVCKMCCCECASGTHAGPPPCLGSASFSSVVQERCRGDVIRRVARAMPQLRELYLSSSNGAGRPEPDAHVSRQEIRAAAPEAALAFYDDELEGSMPFHLGGA